VPVGTAPSLPSRIFHNKFLSWGLTLMKNYFRPFSTEFLFTHGDINFRHSLQGGFGQFYWWEIIFLLAGLFFLLTRFKEKKIKFFILGWLLLAPLPSILTRDGGNHATRLILILPPLLMIISFGFWQIWSLFLVKKWKYFWVVVLSVVFLIQFSLYLHRYYIHYPLESEEWWHYGYKELATYAKENEEKYDFIVFSDRSEPPLIFTLFWTGLDPKIIQENELVWTEISDALSADHLQGSKYYFGHLSEERLRNSGLNGTLKENILYLAPQVEIKKDFRLEPVPESIDLLQNIYYPSGRLGFYILTGK